LWGQSCGVCDVRAEVLLRQGASNTTIAAVAAIGTQRAVFAGGRVARAVELGADSGRHGQPLRR